MHLAGARALAAAGLRVEALTAGRDALSLTAAGEAQDVLAVLAETMTGLGRPRDAAAMVEAWRASRSADAGFADLPAPAAPPAPPASAADVLVDEALTALAEGLGRDGAAARLALERGAASLDRLDHPAVAAVARALAAVADPRPF